MSEAKHQAARRAMERMRFTLDYILEHWDDEQHPLTMAAAWVDLGIGVETTHEAVMDYMLDHFFPGPEPEYEAQQKAADEWHDIGTEAGYSASELSGLFLSEN